MPSPGGFVVKNGWNSRSLIWEMERNHGPRTRRAPIRRSAPVRPDTHSAGAADAERAGDAGDPPTAQFAGRSLSADDCPHGHVCETPERLDLQRQKHDADDKLGVVPDPAPCPQPRPSDDRPIDRSEHEAASAPARSFESPPSHATPNVATTACPSDISIGDAGDISIGDLQAAAA